MTASLRRLPNGLIDLRGQRSTETVKKISRRDLLIVLWRDHYLPDDLAAAREIAETPEPLRRFFMGFVIVSRRHRLSAFARRGRGFAWSVLMETGGHVPSEATIRRVLARIWERRVSGRVGSSGSEAARRRCPWRSPAPRLGYTYSSALSSAISWA
jgi:hypothetical protein